MKQKEKRQTIGRTSYVLSGKSRGGMITVRIPQELHLQLAAHCRKQDISMNKYLIAAMMEKMQRDGVAD